MSYQRANTQVCRRWTHARTHAHTHTHTLTVTTTTTTTTTILVLADNLGKPVPDLPLSIQLQQEMM